MLYAITKAYMLKLVSDDKLEKMRLKQNMEVALAEFAPYLMEKLAIDEELVHNAQFFGHQNHGGRKGAPVIIIMLLKQ